MGRKEEKPCRYTFMPRMHGQEKRKGTGE